MNNKNAPQNKGAMGLPNEMIVPTVGVPQAPRLSVEQAMQIAEQHQMHGRLQQAEIVLRDILNAAPDFPPALHLLGVVAHIAGKTDVAIELIGKAIAGNGKVALFHTNIAEMYRLQKRLDEALKHGKKAVNMDPKLISAQSNLGIIYFDRKEYDKAEYHHKLVLKTNPNFAPSLNNMGSISRQHKDYHGAEKYFRAAIKSEPNFLDPQNNLGEILTRLEQPEEAVQLLNQVLAVNPKYESAHCNLGMAHLALGQEMEAGACYVRALQADPKFIAAYAGLVMVALEFHRYKEGEHAARKLLELAPEEPDSSSMLGSILLAQGLTEQAEEYFKKALALDKDFDPAKTGMGNILMERGDMKGAEELFRSCLRHEGDESPALCSLIQVKKIKEGDPEIALLEKEAEKLKGRLVDSKAIPLNFALGKMYDDLGQYEKGFPYYIAGCRLKRKSFEYEMEAKEQSVDDIKKVFTKEFIAKNSGHGDSSDAPIFVLGMPRSGTTLTEQIIASHPSVHGAGELRDMMELTDKISPDNLDQLWSQRVSTMDMTQLKALGQEYVAGLQKRNPEAVKITDKMPGNFHYVGLIHMMLPNAKIVHVSRHPLDTCISCFTRLFAHGQANTYDLEEIGHYYKCYKGLMDHWQSVLPEGSFYNSRYEELIDDTEGKAKELIAYCGLEWDNACLEFYKNKRSIRTASVTQVRQPIYKSSKQRWKNYEQFLAPMIKGLGDAVEL